MSDTAGRKTFKPDTPDQLWLLPPALRGKLLRYAYCTGRPSSRQLEKATYEEVPYRVLAAIALYVTNQAMEYFHTSL